VAGVVLLGDEQVELLDVYWVFGEYSGDEGEAEQPLCLLSGDDGWMASFVKPLLESAGYRVTTALKQGEKASVVLASDETGPVGEAAPVVRLRRRKAAAKGDDSIYRYDRAGLLSALEAKVGAR